MSTGGTHNYSHLAAKFAGGRPGRLRLSRAKLWLQPQTIWAPIVVILVDVQQLRAKLHLPDTLVDATAEGVRRPGQWQWLLSFRLPDSQTCVAGQEVSRERRLQAHRPRNDHFDNMEGPADDPHGSSERHQRSSDDNHTYTDNGRKIDHHNARPTNDNQTSELIIDNNLRIINVDHSRLFVNQSQTIVSKQSSVTTRN